jgi:hypothetical protein
LTIAAPEFLGKSVERLGVSRRDRDARACRPERPRDRRSDPPACAGDKRHSFCHVSWVGLHHRLQSCSDRSVIKRDF